MYHLISTEELISLQTRDYVKRLHLISNIIYSFHFSVLLQRLRFLLHFPEMQQKHG